MSLRLKTILGVALIEAVLLAILITTTLNHMHKTSQDSLVEYAKTTTSLFATTTKNAVLSFDLASLESFVKDILKNEQIRYVRVLDADNNVLAKGGDDKLLSTPFVADSGLDSVNDGIYDAMASIAEADTLYGKIQIGIDTQHIREELTSVTHLSASLAGIEMGLVALFSLLLGTYLTKELKALHLAASSISDGNLDYKIEVKGKDEVAVVANAFNKMVMSLKASDQSREAYARELEDLNANLERRVKERTLALESKNSELSKAYTELQHAQSQLLQSEKMASVGQLAAGVAHEINNPIGFVGSNLETMKDYIKTYKDALAQYARLSQLAADIAEHEQENLKLQAWFNEVDFDFIQDDVDSLLGESIEGTQRVSKIVKGLNAFSRVDQEEWQEANINSCLEDTLRLASNELKFACEVVTRFEDLPNIRCNPGQLNQVFMNLVMNAKQAMKEKGTLTITTKQSNDRVLISIQDDGAGIAKENLQKLFDPFFTTKPVGKGTGLGLSISLGIVQEHEGTICVDSEVGQGTTFTISLPTAGVGSGEVDADFEGAA